MIVVFVIVFIIVVLITMVVLSTRLGKLGAKRFTVDGVPCLVEDSDVLN